MRPHYGSTVDSLFAEMGMLQEMNERLSKRIFVEQLKSAMARRRISLSEFARRMGTSRTAARRLLDHTVTGATFGSLVSASAAVGMAFEPRLMEARKNATYIKRYGLGSAETAEEAKRATYEKKVRRHA